MLSESFDNIYGIGVSDVTRPKGLNIKISFGNSVNEPRIAINMANAVSAPK
jgi:hypothetical protein